MGGGGVGGELHIQSGVAQYKSHNIGHFFGDVA